MRFLGNNHSGPVIYKMWQKQKLRLLGGKRVPPCWCPHALPGADPTGPCRTLNCVLLGRSWHLAGLFRLILEAGLVTSVPGTCPSHPLLQCFAYWYVICSSLAVFRCLSFLCHFKGSAVTLLATWLLCGQCPVSPLAVCLCLGSHLLFAWGFFVLLLASVIC